MAPPHCRPIIDRIPPNLSNLRSHVNEVAGAWSRNAFNMGTHNPNRHAHGTPRMPGAYPSVEDGDETERVGDSDAASPVSLIEASACTPPCSSVTITITSSDDGNDNNLIEHLAVPPQTPPMESTTPSQLPPPPHIISLEGTNEPQQDTPTPTPTPSTPSEGRRTAKRTRRARSRSNVRPAAVALPTSPRLAAKRRAAEAGLDEHAKGEASLKKR
ncbi:hypothetical protein B0A55_04835 [Friedmanniomyces simplex]|uniref:Uncharacterized protein n=1 Tax=Friedmanniomyces simplex TaxID=329884 RepID=A0A4U0XAI3_9PEZI|nr:hypothetical protein B0A55_04835 [Friedmanniomyces simplex]